MPLTRSNAEPRASSDAVYFEMRVAATGSPVSCSVAYDFLEAFGLVRHPTQEEMITAFHHQRESIERIGRTQFKRGITSPHVTLADV